jgi:hypothetical protein
MMKSEAGLYTVWHTGSKYFAAGLRNHYDRVTLEHLTAGGVSKINMNADIYTTYRDPYRVAASWINRGHFEKESILLNHMKWVDQWNRYEHLLNVFDPIVLHLEKGRHQAGLDFGGGIINSQEDIKGIHRALDQGKVEKVYDYLPKVYLDHAIMKSRGALERESDPKEGMAQS